MFEKLEIIWAIKNAKINQKKYEILNLFEKDKILNNVNRNRWYKGASKDNGFMKQEEFDQIIKNKRTFFTTLNFMGLSKDFQKIKERKGYFVEMKVKEKI